MGARAHPAGYPPLDIRSRRGWVPEREEEQAGRMGKRAALEDFHEGLQPGA